LELEWEFVLVCQVLQSFTALIHSVRRATTLTLTGSSLMLTSSFSLLGMGSPLVALLVLGLLAHRELVAFVAGWADGHE
jgi:hypothetical protein